MHKSKNSASHADKKGWLNWLHPISGKWEKLTFINSHAVSAVGVGETIYAVLSRSVSVIRFANDLCSNNNYDKSNLCSATGYYLWEYNTKNGEQRKRRLDDDLELGTCCGAFAL